VNGVHPLVEVFDGFFIHSRSAGGAPFGPDNIGGLRLDKPAFIRNDLGVPVFQFQTETDMFGLFHYLAARQPDTDRLRTWEVAGTAHADAHILAYNASAGAQASATIGCEAVNDGPKHFVIKAALHALDAWLRDGTEPPHSEQLMDTDGEPTVDANGNTLGGIRTPDVDVPIATLSGAPPEGSDDVLCSLFGHTAPFPASKLMDLYPTHADYVMRVTDSARMARDAGFLLEPEEQAIVSEAESASVPE